MDSEFRDSGPRSYWPADRSVPVLERTLGDALRSAAVEFKDDVAVIDGADAAALRRRWTFKALLSESETVARALLARFAPGERIALWAPNSPEWLLLEFGAAMAGLTLVTVNPAYQAKELTYVLRQSRVAGVIAAHEYRNRNLMRVVEEVRSGLPLLREIVSLDDWPVFSAGAAVGGALPEVVADDIAQIQYTSGTTGFPKGAMLTHRGLINNARFYALANGAAADDVWINPMPLFHTAGCGLVTLGALQTGGKHVLMPRFDPGLMLQLVESERGTITGGVPTMMIAALEQDDHASRDLSSWRLVSMGGAPVPADLVTRLLHAFGVRVTIGFGQTEASPFITHTQPDDPRPDWATTVGRPLPQTEVKIVDLASGQTMPCGGLGELCARGYLVMKGYFDDPVVSEETIDSDGWLHTGDLATMDADGYCRIQGRMKDMIIRGGENIYPREIEAVLFGHPAVADVAVVGVPHNAWGEEVAAFVRPAKEPWPTQDELLAYCRERLAAYKAPRHWYFVDQFPQTASGKVQKFVLREMALRETPAEAGEASRPASGDEISVGGIR